MGMVRRMWVVSRISVFYRRCMLIYNHLWVVLTTISLGWQAFARIAPPLTTSSLTITHTVKLDVAVFNNESLLVLPPGISLGVFSL